MSKIQGMAGKGALVIQDPDNPVPKVIKFQYNPESLSRSFPQSNLLPLEQVKMTSLKHLG